MANEMRAGVLLAFNAGTFRARVRFTGTTSLHQSLDNIPTNRGIAAGDMIAGRVVAVVIFDETRADDAMVLGVF